MQQQTLLRRGAFLGPAAAFLSGARQVSPGHSREVSPGSAGRRLELRDRPGKYRLSGGRPAVIAVGAVDSTGQRVCYSSCGPNSHKPKPDFVAVVPFPSRWRSQPFTGTSAAAPQAAAMAALLWSCYPQWNADQVRTAMQHSAQDLGPAGHDFETGYGLIRLPQTLSNPSRIVRASRHGP